MTTDRRHEPHWHTTEVDENGFPVELAWCEPAPVADHPVVVSLASRARGTVTAVDVLPVAVRLETLRRERGSIISQIRRLPEIDDEIRRLTQELEDHR